MKLKFLALFATTFCATSATAEDLYFLLTNESSAAVTAFHVSTSSSENWEENLIDGGYLDSGYEINVRIADGQTTCVYDVLAEFADGATLEDYNLDLCEMGSYTFSD
ncbi:hypothetical protein [Shimia sagamensis]|uniref:Argininosuccinate lyase n=1 Tax=Shimia sagamensis TaxID=1566352 RepID=A0ABY1NK88_9RHOB|nr:hypothetical protein [Shimia sagamensis]SMP11127.1 hypothetical protein SAMN06265373_102236 [Shimia sagamensis]